MIALYKPQKPDLNPRGQSPSNQLTSPIGDRTGQTHRGQPSNRMNMPKLADLNPRGQVRTVVFPDLTSSVPPPRGDRGRTPGQDTQTKGSKMQNMTPETVWNSGAGTPTIQPIPRANGAYEIAVIIDGGYNLEDAQHMTNFWAQQLTRAGLKTRPRLTAEAIKIEPNRTHPGAYVVTVKCPYCPDTHTHGVDALESNGGHRAPHCHDPEAQQWNKAGYFIHIPETVLGEIK